MFPKVNLLQRAVWLAMSRWLMALINLLRQGKQPKSPAGWTANIHQHVYLSVAAIFLFVGSTPLSAQAAQDRTVSGSSIVYEVGRQTPGGASHGAAFVQARAALTQEQKNREAAQRFGEWGPELVRAADVYGQDPAVLHRVMMCESKGDPRADNGNNKGLFQFDPATWVGTPFGSRDIYDAQAQIHGAAWMWSQGRKVEWECE